MSGIEHHRRALERHLADLESLLAGAERKYRAEGEIGRAVLGRWVKHARCAADYAHGVLAGFRREAALREARAGEPLARRARRYFTRDSPLLLRLKLCWELERALWKMDDVLEEETCSLVSKSDCLVEMPGGVRDVAGKEAVVQALLDDRHTSARVLLIVELGTTATKGGGSGKSSLATAVFNDPRVRSHFAEKVAWRRVPRGLEADTVLRAVIVPDMLRERDDLRSAVSPAAGAPGDEAVGGRKRFLLVVDGVWSDREERRNWENTMIPSLRSDSLRAPGSMVVVTTRRSPAVATIFR